MAELGGRIGAGLSYATGDGRWTLSADYDMEVKEDFLGHTGELEARYHF